jgi:type IV secretory pathway TrbF-like protein
MDRYEIVAFIDDARTVRIDPQLEHEMLNWLLVHTHGAAGKFVDEYYHSEDFAHNPFKIAEKRTISVQIDSILQVTPVSYQVRRTSVHRTCHDVFESERIESIWTVTV